MPATLSRAATKCISDVPGLAKQTLTPACASVRTRLSAPFIGSPAVAVRALCIRGEADEAVMLPPEAWSSRRAAGEERTAADALHDLPPHCSAPQVWTLRALTAFGFKCGFRMRISPTRMDTGIPIGQLHAPCGRSEARHIDVRTSNSRCSRPFWRPFGSLRLHDPTRRRTRLEPPL